jgi:hypothetical protein
MIFVRYWLTERAELGEAGFIKFILVGGTTGGLLP